MAASSSISSSSLRTVKRVLASLAIVCVSVAGLDYLIGKTLRYYYFKEFSGPHYRTTYGMEQTRANILVFGSSRAHHHYVPESFERDLHGSFYNMGRDGQSILFQIAMLRSVLQRYTPEKIILDFDGDFEQADKDYGSLSALLPYYRTHPELRTVAELRSPFEKLKLLSEIYPFNSEFPGVIMGNIQLGLKRKPDDKGYVPFYGEINQQFEPAEELAPVAIDGEKVKFFREFLHTARQSGAEVYVVYSPTMEKYRHNQELRLGEEICASEHVAFLDLSRVKPFYGDVRYFYDTSHLNDGGAKIFSKRIADTILHLQG